MKKTISVNLKGLNFILEEDAYERLENYIQRLKLNLANQEGSDDILEDIELRIAELFSSKIDETKQVIDLSDLMSILETLGDPDVFITEDEDDNEDRKSSTHSYSEQTHSNHKKLFRDVDNASIAGVCAGLANFFSIDVLIVRIIWAISFFFFGTGLFLYIILWIVIPRANTTIDRLKMQGKAVTVDSVKEEVERAAERFSTSSKRFAQNIRQDAQYKTKINFIGRFISVCIGILAWMFGLSLFITFLTFVLGGFQFIPAITDDGFLSFTEFGQLLLATPDDVNLAWIGGLLVTICSILFLFLLGFRFIFNNKTKWTNRTLAILFSLATIGGILCIILGIRTGRDMAIVGEDGKKIGTVKTENLIIMPQSKFVKDDDGYTENNNYSNWFITIKGNKMYGSGIRMKYRESTDSLFHIYQVKNAHSHTIKNGNKKASNIVHEAFLYGDTLVMDSEFKFPKHDKIRWQEVTMIIEIPKGKTATIGKNIVRLGEDEPEDDEKSRLHESGRLRSDGAYSHWD